MAAAAQAAAGTGDGKHQSQREAKQMQQIRKEFKEQVMIRLELRCCLLSLVKVAKKKRENVDVLQAHVVPDGSELPR